MVLLRTFLVPLISDQSVWLIMDDFAQVLRSSRETFWSKAGCA